MCIRDRFMLALAISYVQELQEYVQPATCFSAIMAGLGISYMIAITNEIEYGNRFYVTGILLISLWSYSLARLRFGYAVLTNVLIILGYEFFVMNRQPPRSTQDRSAAATLMKWSCSRPIDTG